MTQRQKLHELLDRLPEDKLARARRALSAIEADREELIDLADEMDPEELEQFDKELEQSLAQMRAGQTRLASEILREL